MVHQLGSKEVLEAVTAAALCYCLVAGTPIQPSTSVTALATPCSDKAWNLIIIRIAEVKDCTVQQLLQA
jgi:hypothetical protein